ncbi:MAG TPA: hypothetical protein VN380_08835 [Thermoanaerobaculia bacterium]|jgi:hypothetical protein|nr:hypothetical protein [Thermoanaerobaculia bacterium]
MTRIHRLLFTAALLLLAASAFAEQLDVNTILARQKAGASADALLAAVNDPANTLAIKADDVTLLRSGGVPETVIAAIQQRIANQSAAAPAPATAQVAPDDARLMDVVRIAKSGISESLIAEQIKQSGVSYKLSMNDLLYLKQNSVQDSVISALLATKEQAAKKAAAGPEETAFNELLLVHGWGPLRRERPGRLLLKGETFSWIDGTDPKENFEFQTQGLEKVWYTCQSQTAGEVCYQINFQIVKGPRYSFADVSRATGSNATVKAVMETLRKNFPRAPFGASDH